MIEGQIWLWVGFNLFVLAMLALDLGVFHRKSHAVSTKEALIWSIVWVSLSLVFNLVIYLYWDRMMPNSSYTNGEAGLAFLTGYLIEKALSVDNIFVFVLIFTFFAVPDAYQHRVLFWGILGALIMRGVMIFAGVALLKQFHWIIYVFGAFLIFTGIRMAFHKDEELKPDQNPVVKLFRRLMPVTKDSSISICSKSWPMRKAWSCASLPTAWRIFVSATRMVKRCIRCGTCIRMPIW